MEIPFFKYHGTGNDFVIFDGRDTPLITMLDEESIAAICHRRFGIGADGVMILQDHPSEDFNMVYFNSDGKPSSMCGNGGRCLVSFAHRMGLFKDRCTFMAIDGLHEATIKGDQVELKMNDVTELEKDNGNTILNTGSPHYVKHCSDLDALSITEAAHAIRYNERFAQEGINVNFIQPVEEGIRIRTYERGVEDETWACGTGATAAAIAFVEGTNTLGNHEIQVKVEGGSLVVKLNKTATGYNNVWLCGPAQFVFSGVVDLETI